MFWNIVLGVASFALNLLLSPKPQSAKPASLADFGIPTAEEGLEIPVAFGSVWVYPNTVWYGDLVLQPIKGPRRYGFFGPRVTTGYRYGVGMHLLLCHSTHDHIKEIWAEKKLFPKAPSTATFDGTGVLVIDQMNIYGGDEAGGGVFGSVHVLAGSAGQTVDAYLQAQLGTGANTPAFRGVVSLVWEHLYIGNSPYIKPWHVYLQRIHRTATGDEQWYDAKAAVPDSHATLGTDTGVALLPSTGSMNSPKKIDSYGDWAARAERVGDGFLQVWHLPDGEMQTDIASEAPGATGYGDSVHVTAFDEILVRYGGNIFGGAATYIRFVDPENFPSTTQTDINIHSIVNAYGTDLNWGFTAAEYGDFILLKVNPEVSDQLPWILLERVDGEWEYHSDHGGVDWAGTAAGARDISMGPDYAYVVRGSVAPNGISLVTWNPDLSWDEVNVDYAALGITGSLVGVHYFAGTNEVIVKTTAGIFICNEDMTSLLRSKTDFSPSLGSSPMDGRRTTYSSSSILLYTTNNVSYEWVYEFNVASMEITRSIDVTDTSFVNKSGTSPNQIKVNRQQGGLVIGGHGTMALSFWPVALPDAPNMNPAHIIREALTDRTWGMGYASADIDDDSFTAAADTLWDECFGLSLLWTREQPLDEFISMILSHIDAYLYLRRDTGKFFLKLVRNDYDPDTIPQFTEADVVSWDEVTHRQPAEAINTVTVKWTDRNNQGKDAATSYDNIAQIQQIGSRVPATRFYPGITYGPLASSVARRDQRTLGIGLINGRLTGHRTFDQLYPGDPFRLVSAKQNLDGEVFRVAEMTFGDGRKNAIGVKFLQDIFRMNLEDIIDTSGSDWENPVTDPEPVEPRLVWEMPYFELSQMVGSVQADAMLTGDPDAGMIEVSGAQPSGTSLQADIYVDGADTDEVLSLWAPAGTLDAGLTASPTDDSITITDDFDADAIEDGMLAALVDPADPTNPDTIEIVRIDAIASLTLTIARGMLDTAPMAHAAGTWLVVFNDFVGTDAVQRTAGDTPSVELLTRTMSAVLSTSSAPDDEITLDSRAIRPLRPADVQVNSLGEGPIDLTGVNPIPTAWARRNRLTETTPLVWDDADETPEGGQTTIIRLLDPVGVVIDDTTYAGIAGTTQDIDPADFGGVSSGILEFGSQRDGYDSWQAYRVAVIISADALLLEGDATDGDDVLLLEGDESGQLLLEGST